MLWYNLNMPSPLRGSPLSIRYPYCMVFSSILFQRNMSNPLVMCAKYIFFSALFPSPFPSSWFEPLVSFSFLVYPSCGLHFCLLNCFAVFFRWRKLRNVCFGVSNDVTKFQQIHFPKSKCSSSVFWVCTFGSKTMIRSHIVSTIDQIILLSSSFAPRMQVKYDCNPIKSRLWKYVIIWTFLCVRIRSRYSTCLRMFSYYCVGER